MKVLVILGSTRRPGTSTTLADSFIQGAKEAGHDVVVYDAAKNPITSMHVDENNRALQAMKIRNIILIYCTKLMQLYLRHLYTILE